MTTSPIDSLARHAAGVHTRRTSLTALGAALLAAAATAPFTASTSAKKKKKGKVSKDVKKICAQQVGFCKSGWSVCGDSEICKGLAGCCDFLKTCDAAAQVKCMTDIL